MRLFDVANSERRGDRPTRAAAGIVLVLGLAAFVSHSSAADGNLKSMSMQLTVGGGIAGPLRVVSEDGQSWNAFAPGSELLMQGSIKVEMTTGNPASDRTRRRCAE